MKHFFQNSIHIRCIILLFYSFLVTTVVFGQQQLITIDKNNITIDELLAELRKQTGYDFVSMTSKIDFSKKINSKFKNAKLTDVLNAYFNIQTGVVYVCKNNSIILMDEQKANIISFKGKVINADTGRPIAGASVSFSPKGIRTLTNEEGRFNIRLPEYVRVLDVIYLGYEKQTVDINSEAAEITIHLKEKVEGIDEVIVTGLFERPKESFTGSAKTIGIDELKQVNAMSLLSAVAALDPSFVLVENNRLGSDINNLPEVKLRGENSLPNLSGELAASPNLPLFILDGFETTLRRVVDLDMNLIKSITLLKDASATSFYGSRGANGVMVITTHEPKAGKVTISYNNDFRLMTPDLSVYNLLNSKEKLEFEKRAGVYDGLGQPRRQYDLDVLYNNRLKAVEQGVETDWMAKPTQFGYSNRSSLYLEGGDQYIRYGIQLSGDFQKGVMKGQGRNNYSGQFQISYQLKNLRFQNMIRIFQNNALNSPYGSFATYVKLNPYWQAYDADGKLNPILSQSPYVPNPLNDAELNTKDESQYFGVTNNFLMRYNPFKGFTLETTFALNKQNGGSDRFLPAQHSAYNNEKDLKKKGIYTVSNTNSLGYEGMLSSNFNRSFGKHVIYSTAAFNVANNSTNSYSVSATGFPFDRLDNLLFATQYRENSRPSGDESTVRRLGYLLNVNYSWSERFLADLSVRRDGSSQFGLDKRYGTFWSTGLGWNLHHERFLKGNLYINKLKLRTNYGVTGSLNVPAYQAQTRYSFTTENIYNNDLGAYMQALGNPDLGWQNVGKFNVGADLTLLNNRLDLRFDYYSTLTDNTITTINLAPSVGFSSFAENLGKVKNQGYEISGRYIILSNKESGLLWSIHSSVFSNKNILLELSNKIKVDPTLNNNLLKEGEPLNTIYVVRSIGVDPITGADVFLTKNNEKTFDWNAIDRVPFGVTDPKMNGVFGTNLNYKGFSMNMIFDFRFGGQQYNYTLVEKVEAVDPIYNVDRRAFDLGWKGPGDNSMYKRIGVDRMTTYQSSRFVQDENTINLNTISLGYNFYKSSFIKKIGLRSLQLNAITNDLFRISTIKMERGIANPFAHTYSFSIRAVL